MVVPFRFLAVGRGFRFTTLAASDSFGLWGERGREGARGRREREERRREGGERGQEEGERGREGGERGARGGERGARGGERGREGGEKGREGARRGESGGRQTDDIVVTSGVVVNHSIESVGSDINCAQARHQTGRCHVRRTRNRTLDVTESATHATQKCMGARGIDGLAGGERGRDQGRG